MQKSNDHILQFIEASNKRSDSALDNIASKIGGVSLRDSKAGYNAKNLDFMRRDPPDSYVPGTNVYAHLVLVVDRYINKYKFSKTETAHCLALVF